MRSWRSNIDPQLLSDKTEVGGSYTNAKDLACLKELLFRLECVGRHSYNNAFFSSLPYSFFLFLATNPRVMCASFEFCTAAAIEGEANGRGSACRFS